MCLCVCACECMGVFKFKFEVAQMCLKEEGRALLANGSVLKHPLLSVK